MISKFFVLVAALALGAVHVSSPSSALAQAPTAGAVLEAYTTLRDADMVESAHVGIAGAPSQNAEAFRRLLAHPQAARLFRDLLVHGSAAGRLYGLSGLYFTEPKAFPRELERLARAGGKVNVIRGCLVHSVKVAELARDDIADGDYPLMFAGRDEPSRI